MDRKIITYIVRDVSNYEVTQIETIDIIKNIEIVIEELRILFEERQRLLEEERQIFFEEEMPIFFEEEKQSFFERERMTRTRKSIKRRIDKLIELVGKSKKKENAPNIKVSLSRYVKKTPGKFSIMYINMIYFLCKYNLKVYMICMFDYIAHFCSTNRHNSYWDVGKVPLKCCLG